ncbi:hypothetical protein [Latilactobacillus curvatus]|uniref:hypothetical protein n=1 Tax=Latilactobacillus curvatus TaxID=28038 RepID=UPI0009753BD5|nr:hypothetical protein [Latilactobacillus curvatus]
MKEALIFILFILCLIVLLPSPVAVRAGGSSGGSGGSGGGSSPTSGYVDGRNRDYYYDDAGYRHYYKSPMRRLFDSIVTLLFVFVSLGIMIWRKVRDWLTGRRKRAPADTMPLDAETAARFENAFYQIEKAWPSNDLSDVADLMTPHFQHQQQRILSRYQRYHKHNQLESITIVSTELLLPEKPNRQDILVTAQMRDYFTDKRQTATVNDQRREAAYIERFSEIWTFKLIDGQYRVAHINQSL